MGCQSDMIFICQVVVDIPIRCDVALQVDLGFVSLIKMKSNVAKNQSAISSTLSTHECQETKRNNQDSIAGVVNQGF